MRPEKKKPLALVCLQAQHVAGLPSAAEGRQVVLRLQQQQETAARCRAGVAAFHDHVLLLDCAPVDGIASVDVTVSFRDDDDDHPDDYRYTAAVDLAAQLHRPSPSVLTFVLGGGGGGVLSLTLHHRLVHRQPTTVPDLVLNCCCLRTTPGGDLDHPAVTTGRDDRQSSSSSGFITIEKGTISRRRPPSDNLFTTDDDDDSKPPTSCWTWYPVVAEELEIEEEFLDKLDQHRRSRSSWDLDALIKDAEADIAELCYL